MRAARGKLQACNWNRLLCACILSATQCCILSPTAIHVSPNKV
jgi:hypothetical protein